MGSEEISWIGEGVRIKNRRTMKTYYESFANGLLFIKKNDYVMISNEEAGELSESPHTCYVARVLDLYDNGSGKDNRHRAVVEWFLRPADLTKYKTIDLKKLNKKWEVIRYNGKKMWDVDIDAESIFGVCKVKSSAVKGFVSNKNDEPVFFNRWSFDGTRLDAVKSAEIDENRTVMTARRCLFNSTEKSVEKCETKSPFKSFYTSSEKRKSTYVERDVKRRKIFDDDEAAARSRRKLFKEKKKDESPIDETTRTDDPFEEARKNLHVSMVPSRLPCREDEYEEIYSFVKNKLEMNSNGCIYISGVPGSGKTATVLEVMKTLNEEKENGNLCDFKFVALNGMKLTDPHQIYVQIVKELMGLKMSAQYAINFLSKHFGKWSKEHVVLLIDELDLLYTKRQDVLYNLFEWPSRPKARLVVIAVANTMNLPERIMTNRVVSRVGMARITFQPYSYQQLQQIIELRVSEFHAFKLDAIRLVARKVGGVSGDARRALDICRRATEIADEVKCVTVSHVDKALQEMFSSPKFLAIQNASLVEQTLLRVIANQFEHSGVEEHSWAEIYPNLVALCRLEGIFIPNESQACSACSQLSSCRLVIADNGRLGNEQRIRLNVGTEDVAFALDCKL